MDLVVYYTRTNNTKDVAEIIAKEKNTQTLEIKDKKSRSGAVGFMMGGFDAIRGKKTTITYDKVNLDEFDTIYIGTPVWASKPTPAILKFIEENDFSGKNVVTFATMGGSGGDSTIKTLNEHIQAKGGIIKHSFSLAMTNTDIKQAVLDELNAE